MIGLQRLPAFLFALLLLLSAYNQDANAQASPKLRVLVTECLNHTPKADQNLDRATTDAIYIELARSGRERFTLISKQEVWAAAERLNLPVPEQSAPSGHWKEEEKFRLGAELNADARFEGEIGVMPGAKNAKSRSVGIFLCIRDIASRTPLTGGTSITQAKTLQETITRGVEDAILQCIRRITPEGRILNRTGENVVLNHGIRDGYRNGNRCIVLREVAGKRVKVGEVRIKQSNASDSEGEVVTETSGIRADDIVVIFYAPPTCIFLVPKK